MVENMMKPEQLTLLRLVRAACLSDHMGDMWGGLFTEAEEVGVEIPMDEQGMANFEKIEAMLKA